MPKSGFDYCGKIYSPPIKYFKDLKVLFVGVNDEPTSMNNASFILDNQSI